MPVATRAEPPALRSGAGRAHAWGGTFYLRVWLSEAQSLEDVGRDVLDQARTIAKADMILPIVEELYRKWVRRTGIDRVHLEIIHVRIASLVLLPQSILPQHEQERLAVPTPPTFCGALGFAVE
eukprot:scaffold1951_cov258-Pinguiococcus_pyrenoidosus.AAC.24